MLSSLTRNFVRKEFRMNPVKGWVPNPNKHPVHCKTAAEAVSHIRSNSHLFIDEAAGSPHVLLSALEKRAPELENVEFVGIFSTGTPCLNIDDAVHRKAFQCNQYFVGPPDRKSICRDEPHACYVPLFLREACKLLRSPDYGIDTALVTLSPPDAHGWCSIGPSTATTIDGIAGAKQVIAEINPNIPRTHGDSFIPFTHVDYFIETNRKLPQFPPGKITPEQSKMGKIIASLIPDGACIQAGIGGVPDAALSCLMNHKNLGVHTEMFASGLIPLIEKGVVNGSQKKIDVGKVTTAFVLGIDKLYKMIDDNPLFNFRSAEYVNDPRVICQNPKMIAINGAVGVDLTGQVCADSLGTRQLSGVGGQMDFVEGASWSEGGRAIIALPSTAANGKISRITTTLKPGSSVSTPRFYGPTIVTEYGYADLWGLNTRQRAQALIKIAHPKFREQLARDAAFIYGK